MLTQNHKHVVACILLSGCLLLARAAAQPNTTTGSYLSDETHTASFSNSTVPSAAPVASSVLPQFALAVAGTRHCISRISPVRQFRFR